MRTVQSASSDVASGAEPRQVFNDAKLRDTKQRAVEAPVFASGTRIADTHAHLDMLHYPELALARAAANGVSFIVSVIDPTEDPAFTLNNLETWQQKAKAILDEWQVEQRDGVGVEQRDGVVEQRDGVGVEQRDGVGVPLFVPKSGTPTPSLCSTPTPSLCSTPAPSLCSTDVALIIGCHPHNASAFTQVVEDQLLRALTTDPRVVGIGEIGLDYHYDHSPRDVQQQVYRRQLRLAHELGSTVTLHMREAHADGLRILKEEGVPKAGFLLHCFNLDYATLEPFLELGAMVAFGGPLTFAKANEVRDSAARCPLNRIMTETDCPFMAPTPIRGSICEPASVVFTAKKLEELRAEPHALEAAYANAKKFFSK
ncbi:MAG: TatD family hydrolase [Coriobacteriia bacterium]|nr:TatD family hydrolase [Coriobacteriia bacterium]MCL2750628.1 TatD family hydrolase [Coriobacteriia bacterium]